MSTKSVNYTLRLTPEMKFELEKIAHKQGRTLSNLITYWLSEKIEECQKK